MNPLPKVILLLGGILATKPGLCQNTPDSTRRSISQIEQKNIPSRTLTNEELHKLWGDLMHQVRTLQEKVTQLSVENALLKKKMDQYTEDSLQKCLTLQNLENDNNDKEKKINGLNKKLAKYTKGVKVGLSFGFNYFWNGQESYYVKEDSTLGSYGPTKGIAFMISGIVSYRFHEKHSLVFNIPLGDLGNSTGTPTGLFNKQVSGGLGYGYHFNNASVIFVVNISQFQKVETNLLRNKKFDAEPYSTVDISDLPTVKAYSPSLTIGISYNIFNALKSGTAASTLSVEEEETE